MKRLLPLLPLLVFTVPVFAQKTAVAPCPNLVRLLHGKTVSFKMKNGVSAPVKRIFDGEMEWLFVMDGEEAVSSLSFRTSTDKKTLVLEDGDTAPEFRGKGMYRKLIQIALELHPQAGTVEAQLAYDNYRRGKAPEQTRAAILATPAGVVFTDSGLQLARFQDQPNAEPPYLDTVWVRAGNSN